MFLPYDERNGQPTPWEYLEASAIGEVHVGTALVLSEGQLDKCTGTDKPQYICMMQGDVAEGDVIPVMAVHDGTRYAVACTGDTDDISVGDCLTIHTDGEQVTTTTGGTAQVVELREDGEVLVKFVDAAADEADEAAEEGE